MENNTIPSLQDDAAFLQLPFDQPIIPYSDLKVTGQPERKLLLQDDLPMTMSVLTAKGSTQQRLVTQNDDGGVNVHVVNGGSSSGISIAPVAMTHGPGRVEDATFTAGVTEAFLNFNPGTNLYILYGFTFGVVFTALPGVGNYGAFRMSIGRQDNPANHETLNLVELQINGPISGMQQVPNGFHETIMYPIPIDIATTFGVNNISQCLSLDSDFPGVLSIGLFGGWAR